MENQTKQTVSDNNAEVETEDITSVARENTLANSEFFEDSTPFDVVNYVARIHFELAKINGVEGFAEKYPEARNLIENYGLSLNVAHRIIELEISENEFETSDPTLEQETLNVSPARAENASDQIKVDSDALAALQSYACAYKIVDAFAEQRDEWRSRADKLNVEFTASRRFEPGEHETIKARIHIAREQAEHFARAAEFAEKIIAGDEMGAQ